MIRLQDPTKTIVDALEDNWGEVQGIPKNYINFVRHEPLDLETRFAKGHRVSIEVRPITEPISKRSLARQTHKEVVGINVWVDISPITEKEKVATMDIRQKLKDEIDRILKLVQATLTDIRFAFPRSWQPIDNLGGGDEKPYLRSLRYVVCLHEK